MTTTPSYDTSFESNLLTTDPKQTRDMASMSDVSIYSAFSELIGSQFNMLEPLHFELFLYRLNIASQLCGPNRALVAVGFPVPSKLSPKK